MRSRTRTLVAALTAVAATAVAAGPAAADADHTSTLRQVCEAHDGTWVPRPGYWRARCAGARPSNGADGGARQARVVCTMQMAGEFHVATAADGTTAWVCV